MIDEMRLFSLNAEQPVDCGLQMYLEIQYKRYFYHRAFTLVAS